MVLDISNENIGHARSTELVVEHTNTVCSIALAIVGELKASEEVAQNVFRSAWSGLRGLHNPDSFRPWLRKLTRNAANEYLALPGRWR